MLAPYQYLAAPAALLIASLATASPAMAEDEYPGAVAQDAEKLEPRTPWGLDYGENSCRLARIFGPEDDKHVLFFEQGWPGDSFGMTIAGSSFKRYNRGDRIHLGFQSDVPMFRIELPPTGTIGDYGPAVILANVGVNSGADRASPRLRIGTVGPNTGAVTRAGLDPAEGAKIDRVVVKRGGKALSFETGNLEEAFGALNACTSDLLTGWGLDPEKHKAYRPVQWINQAEVVDSIVDKYPRSALNRGEQAVFRMRVIVDKEGTVAECQIDAATTAENLESPACAEMEAARFTPAIDAEGQPMRSFFASTVRYQIRQ